MPDKNMKKKAMIIEALMRTLLMIGLLVLSFYAVAKVYRAISPEKDESYLKNMVGILNELGDGSIRPFLLGLSENSALVGFSRGAADFRCVGCAGSQKSTDWETLQITKPQVPECASSACVCLCSDISKSEKSTPTQSPYRLLSTLSCRQTKCKQLINNIPEKLYLLESHGATFYQNVNAQNWPYWENGFFFENSKEIQNGILNEDIKKELSLQAKMLQGSLFVAACTVETKGCMYEVPMP
jgi:hypothetical protein